MGNTIGIQTEFENLLVEIKQFKTLYEKSSPIISTETVVISNVDSFIATVEQLMQTVTMDWEQSNLKINSILNELTDAATEVNNKSKKRKLKLTDDLMSNSKLLETHLIQYDEVLESELKKLTETFSNTNDCLHSKDNEIIFKIIEKLMSQLLLIHEQMQKTINEVKNYSIILIIKGNEFLLAQNKDLVNTLNKDLTLMTRDNIIFLVFIVLIILIYFFKHK